MSAPDVSRFQPRRMAAAAAALAMASGGLALAQMPLGGQDLEIVRPPAGGSFLRWHRKAGRTYFVQASTGTGALQQWAFLPLIESGPDAVVSFEVASSAPAAFFRLKYTDDPIPAGQTPETADFDQDGIPTIDELLASTDPLAHDSDGDGAPDGIEADFGSNPSDASSHPPQAETFVLTGDSGENEEEHLIRTVTIPAGRACVVFVAVASAEYPEFTGDSSEYNDQLEWDIFPSGGGAGISGSVNVNARHGDWQGHGVTVLGLSPAHVETSRVMQAPASGPLTLTIDLSATNIGDGALPSSVAVGVVPVFMKEVSFSGDKYWELNSDKGPAALGGTVYSAPHWQDANLDGRADTPGTGDRNYPMAFTRGTAPKLAAKLYAPGLPSCLAPRVKATGPGAVAIPATDLVAESGDVWKLPPTASAGSLPNTVKYYSAQEAGKEFRLKWEAAFGTVGTFGNIRDTDHTVYVIYDDPRGAGGPSADFRETLFNIGCRNADGFDQNTNNALVDAIYGEFTDQQVHRVIPSKGIRESQMLHYWKDWDLNTLERGDLLSTDHHNSNCGGWADLFARTIRAQGIKASSVRIESKAHATNNVGVMVKNWHFVTPGSSGNATYPFTIGQDAVALESIPAQGHDGAQPGLAQSFNLHIIALSGGHLYDPSYGSAKIVPLGNGGPDYKKYEDSAFDGFYWPRSAPNKPLARPNDTTPASAVDVDATILPPLDP